MTDIQVQMLEIFRGFLRDNIEKDKDIRTTPIAELGLDSLDFFEYLTQVEEELDMKIEFEALDDQVCLNQIMELVS